jgi:hypothetical protein
VTWSGTTPLSYTYQWQDCDSSGANCQPITGATASSYQLASTDIGHTLVVVVTASNASMPGGASASASSQATSIVQAVAPSNTAPPSISGTAQDGQTLTAANGTWSGSTPITYTYQWQDCDSAGNNCQPIASATGQTYVLAASDMGSTIRVTVTASNAAGSASASSAQTSAVQAAAPSNTAAPSISGSAQEGQTLTATTGSWSGTAPLSYSYQWERCDSSGANCQPISGAASDTYQLTSDDVSSRVLVQVTASNQAGQASASSSPSAVVTGVAPSNITTPSVSGTAQDGQILSANQGTWWGSTPLSYTYQWQRCDATGANCQNISGATGPAYLVTSPDVGMTVLVVVTAQNSAGSAIASSAPTVVIQPASAMNTDMPSISGTAQVGWTLTASSGSWSGTPPIFYTYQWQDCDSTGANCQNISGATSASYTAAASDAGSTLAVEVTASNSAGQQSAASAPTQVVGAAPTDIRAALRDVAGGTATATETDEFESAVDYLETQAGVVPDSVTYQTIGGVQWSQAAYEAALQTAQDSAISGGSTESAVGGELMSSTADLNIVLGPERVWPVIGVGVAALDVWVHNGIELYHIFSDSDDQPQAPPGGWVVPTVAVRKMWFHSSGKTCNYNDTAWSDYVIQGSYPNETVVPGTSCLDGMSWGEDMRLGGADLPPGLPGNGAYVLLEQPQGYGFVAGGRSSTQPGPCYAQPHDWYPLANWLPQQPGIPLGALNNTGTHWINIDNGVWEDCYTQSGDFLGTIDDEYSIEPRTHLHAGFPQPGDCTQVGSNCKDASVNPSSSWCVTASCLFGLFSSNNYANLEQWINAIFGAVSPDTGQTYPKPGTIQVPDCTGVTPLNCKAALSQAGFTATPAENTVSAAQANLSLPAGAVVSTSPAAGLYADKGQAITLNENPNPLPVKVPTPRLGESSTQYQTDLGQVGLGSNIVTLPAPEADWGTPGGGVVYSRPAPGSSVDPGSNVDVSVNPQPMPDPTQTGEKDDSSCDRSTSNYVPQSDQNPSGFTPVSDPSLVESSTFDTSRGPTVLNYGYAQAIVGDTLDFGGWGYWHILAGHGWSLADDADTRTALEDPTPIPGQAANQANPYVFYGPKYAGISGAVCRRVVVVDFGTAPGNPGPKGIITSYGADVNTLPSGYQ